MKTRKRKVFERVVNPLILKHLVSAHGYDGRCIASGIPIKYLSYFKEVSAQKNAKKIRYRYRGKSGLKTQYKTGKQMHYIRPQSFCHMNGADTFAIYYRQTEKLVPQPQEDFANGLLNTKADSKSS